MSTKNVMAKHWYRYNRKKMTGFICLVIIFGMLGILLNTSVSLSECNPEQNETSNKNIDYSIGVVNENENMDTSVEEIVESKSAYLCEGISGKVLYEKEAYKELPPASITKIMTLILIFDKIAEGKIDYTDDVTVSAHAASMGGSQVFLEEGEKQTVEDLIKCISIASANDACVAMAEYIAGSETSFVEQMNERAKGLGMEHTNFVNCCGLDVEGHYSCAADIAAMGRELITKYPEVSDYATTWMDTITHITRKGEKEFGLTNTNKLVRTYSGITGLKTGSTSKAGYCLCATSQRDGMVMISVVMSSKDHKSRFSDCAKLMDYGYSRCCIYKDDKDYSEYTQDIKVPNSIKGSVEGVIEPINIILVNDEKSEEVVSKVTMDEVCAPVTEGDVIGKITYFLNGNEIGTRYIRADKSIEKAEFNDCFKYVFNKLFGKNE